MKDKRTSKMTRLFTQSGPTSQIQKPARPQEQTGQLSRLAENSVPTQRLKILQAKADAPIQFGRGKDWWNRKKAGRSFKKAEKRSKKGGEDEQFLIGGSDSEEEYESDESLDFVELDTSNTEEESEEATLALDGDSESEEAEPTFKWESDEVGDLEGSAALVKIAKRFHKNVFVVRPEEWGGKSFKLLKADLREELEAMPAAIMADEGRTDDAAPLLQNMEGAPKISEQKDDPEQDGEDQAQARLRKIVAKVRGSILSRMSEDRQEVAMVALALAQKEISALLAQHKSWRSTLMAMGAGGPAGYLEEKILPVILNHMSTHLKEFVPMGKGRKTRDKMANLGEGVADITWNAASLGVEALTFGAASAGTSAVGAGYKMGLAGASAKRAGSGYDKAVAQAVVTFVLEFLQGLIPFAGSVLGITGGTRNIYKTIDPRKRLAARGGYGTLRDEDESPDGVGMLKRRIERGEDILSQFDGAKKSRSVLEARLMVEQDLKWMNRQIAKIDKRR